jgi:GGDEF domain-containing protein
MMNSAFPRVEMISSMIQEEAVRAIYHQDLDMFLNEFTKEKLLAAIEKDGVYVIQYRLIINGVPKYVHLTAGMIDEGEQKIVVGINVVDSRVRRELEYSQKLEELRSMSPELQASEAMRFQNIVDITAKPAAVLSVSRQSDGSVGEIRIVRANSAYKETMGQEYYDNMLYYELVPKSVEFEDYCFRSAILGQRLRTYVETGVTKLWTDMEMVPLISPRDDLGYCIFIFELTKRPEASRFANVSIKTSRMAIESCVKLLKTDDFKESVKSVLSDIGAFAEAYSTRIVLIDTEAHNVLNYCIVREESREGIGIPVDETYDYDLALSWESMFDNNNVMIVKDEHDMEYLESKNPAWAESLRSTGITSIIALPLIHNRKIFGYIFVSNFNTEKVIELKEVMEMLSFVLGAQIFNSLLLERMEQMSHTDSLTGAFNRNAMGERLCALENIPFGIISLDINDMKYINEDLGNEAGDHKIIDTYKALTSVFYPEDIFRSGGDEFAVIMPGVQKDVFERKVEKLKDTPEYKDERLFTFGYFWNDSTVTPGKAFTIADYHLFEAKRDYHNK